MNAGSSYTSTVFVTGIPVEICWTWYGPNQIAWCLDKSTNTESALQLLENFLRAMRTDYISCMLEEEMQARCYEEDQRMAAAAADLPF